MGGVNGYGLICINDGEITRRYTPKDGLCSCHISALAVEDDGNVWAGSGWWDRNGIAKITAGKVQTYTVSDGLPDDEVTDIATAQSGDVWVGTYKGLVRIHAGDMEVYFQENSDQNYIGSVEVDEEGVVWISSSPRIRRFDRTSWTTYTRMMDWHRKMAVILR